MMERFAKLAIGVSLGVGAVIASGAALYLMIRSDDDDYDAYDSVDRMITSGRTVTIRVRIPKDAVGAVIGRAGESMSMPPDGSWW